MKISAFIYDAQLWNYLSADKLLTVCGVFSQGIYFRAPGGKLLMLHDTDYGALSFGLAAEGIKGRCRQFGIENEMSAVLCGGELKIPAAGVEIELEQKTLPERPVFQDTKTLKSRRTALLGLLKADGRSLLSCFADGQEDENDPFIKLGAKGISALRAGLEQNNAELTEHGLLGMLGLGRGLTPSFDDFLTGMAFTLNLSEEICGVPLPEAELLSKMIIKLAPEKTGAFSAAYLVSAAGGGCFSLLNECLSVALRSLPDAAQRLLSVGASSGADMLSGLVFALGYIIEKIEH